MPRGRPAKNAESKAKNTNGAHLGIEAKLWQASEDELAFYDALEANDSAVKVMGEPTLQAIARELAAKIRQNITIDWTVRDNVRAQIRILVKRILRPGTATRRTSRRRRRRRCSIRRRSCRRSGRPDDGGGVPPRPPPSRGREIDARARRRDGSAMIRLALP